MIESVKYIVNTLEYSLVIMKVNWILAITIMTYLDLVEIKTKPKHQGVNFSNLITVSPIETIIRPRCRSFTKASSGSKQSNLINVNINKHDHEKSNDFLKIMNCRSLKNKYDTILGYITEQDLSLCFLT